MSNDNVQTKKPAGKTAVALKKASTTRALGKKYLRLTSKTRSATRKGVLLRKAKQFLRRADNMEVAIARKTSKG